MDLEALNHAISVRGSGNQERALQEFRVLIEQTEDPVEKTSLLLNETNILTTLRRFADAWVSLQRARQTSQDDTSKAHADYQEGLLCTWESRYDDALRIYNRILPTYPAVLADVQNRHLYEAVQLDRGTTLAIVGRADEALPLLEEALTYDITDESKGWVFYNLGFCFQIKKQDQKAKSAFEHACRLNSDPNRILGSCYSLGVLYGKEGAWGKALQELEWCEQHFIEGDTPRDYVYGCLVKALRAVGRPAEAEKYRKLISTEAGVVPWGETNS
jgi:tetratricopeptide (TPR) repeat protein